MPYLRDYNKMIIDVKKLEYARHDEVVEAFKRVKKHMLILQSRMSMLENFIYNKLEEGNYDEQRK